MIKVKRQFVLFSVLCFLVSVIAGCGYTTRSLISSKFRTIHIAPFLNKTDITNESYTADKYKIYRPFLETDITRAVVNKFLFDGNLKPIDAESADLLLKGELVDYRRDSLRYTDSEDVSEYRINIAVNISLWDNRENKLIWEEHGYTGDITYFITGPLAKSEAVAMNDAINDLARRIVERTVEQW